MKLTDFFFRNATFFWTCVVMIVFSGIYAYIIMPKLEDPELSVKQAMVVTYYPGASAHEVELEVTSVLEDELRTLGLFGKYVNYHYQYRHGCSGRGSRTTLGYSS